MGGGGRWESGRGDSIGKESRAAGAVTGGLSAVCTPSSLIAFSLWDPANHQRNNV